MKKKGLIISTIVMVIVLVASLTTATYAWFSSNAEAKIESITVQTVAVEGLQVAVKTGDSKNNPSGWATGTLGYTSPNFTGTDGWSSFVDFSALGYQEGTSGALGAMENAVTTIDKIGSQKVYEETTWAVGVYEVGESAMVVTADESSLGGKQYYKEVASTDGIEYVKPIAYTSTNAPIGFQKTDVNDDYLVLPIGVRSTADMKAIGCTIKLTPVFGSISGEYQPGMVSASRILLAQGNVDSGADVKSLENPIELWSNYTAGQSGVTKNEGSTDNDTYSFIIAEGEIIGGATFLTNYTIWIEGTDGECIQLTAGSGFNIEISYSFAGSNETITTGDGNMTFGGVTYAVDATSITGITKPVQD